MAVGTVNDLGEIASSVKRTMNAAVIVAPRQLQIEKVTIPEPGENEFLVKLEGCGVCASNIPPWEGREWFTYPMEPGKLGHEGWGTVAQVGPKVQGVAKGERVAFLSNHSYAEYDIGKVGAYVSLENLPSDQPFPAEPLACALNIFQRSRIGRGDTVAIVGIGFLGALLTRLASHAGAHVIAIARKSYALDFANKMGAKNLVCMDDHWKIIEKVKALTDGKFCDIVIEAVGKQWPLDLASELAKEMGRLIIAGYHQDGLRQVNMQLWNWRGLDVINAHEREHQKYVDGMRKAVDWVETGDLDPNPLFTHRFPLHQLAEAFEMTRERPEGFMKALVTF